MFKGSKAAACDAAASVRRNNMSVNLRSSAVELRVPGIGRLPSLETAPDSNAGFSEFKLKRRSVTDETALAVCR